MKWFDHPETLEDLKKQYKRLAMKHHPDRGGSTEAMQQINAEYETLFSRLKDIHKTAEGETYTAKTASTETAAEFLVCTGWFSNGETRFSIATPRTRLYAAVS